MKCPRGVLHLIDSGQGHVLQTWAFEDRNTITVGRAEENDVVLADPYVSRAHAYLRFDDAGWRLISISRQQVEHEGQLHAELPLSEGTVFRLGKHGCYLQFGQLAKSNDSQTVSFDASQMPVFALDRDKMRREVEQIAGGEYFKSLKDAARALREQRTIEETRL